MCDDECEYNYLSTARRKICRKFVIVNEDDFARTYYVNVAKYDNQGTVALCRIFQHLVAKGLIITNHQFFMPQYNAIVNPNGDCTIPLTSLDFREILCKKYPLSKSTTEIFAQNDNDSLQIEEETTGFIKPYFFRFEQPLYEQFYQMMFQQDYNDIVANSLLSEEEKAARRLMRASRCQAKPTEPCQTKPIQYKQTMIQEHEPEESQKLPSQNSAQIGLMVPQKRHKQNQRQIQQVITAVKVWRGLYESKRCNLSIGSKLIGISKKSLDDYYLILRIGEILHYDYKSNLESKMGDLRNYIRSCDVKVTGKMSKHVECFKYVPEVDLDSFMINME